MRLPAGIILLVEDMPVGGTTGTTYHRVLVDYRGQREWFAVEQSSRSEQELYDKICKHFNIGEIHDHT